MKKIQGIYQIRNIKTNNVYIGSSLDIYARIKNHKNKLDNRKHRNQHLIRSWHKYGKNSFVFEIIEETNLSHEELRKLEQSYLDKVKPYYNISKRADCPYMGQEHFKKMHKASQEKCAKDWIVTNPEGKEFKIKSLKKFCEENKLSLSLMHRVAIGRNSQHKGWKCRYAQDSTPRYISNLGNYYTVVHNKKEIQIRNLSEFLKTASISKTQAYRILDTDKEYNGYKIYSK